jgi:hypothetical protein
MINRATSGRGEPLDCNSQEQNQQHGESHNAGKSKQQSTLNVGYGDIRAGGNVNILTTTRHGLEADPLSSSSPTVGNNQPNGNEGLSQKK